MRSLRTISAALGGAVLVAGLLVGASVAFADDADVPEEGPLTEYADTVREAIEEMRRNLGEVDSLEALAVASGIDLGELISAIEDRVGDAIDKRVAAGDISEERAELLRDRLEAFADGALPFFDRFPAHAHDMWRGSDLFGFLPDGLDLDEAIEDARTGALGHLEQLVEDGVISEERARKLRERIENFDPEGFRFGPFADRFDLEAPFGELPPLREFFGDGFRFDDMPSLEDLFGGEFPLDEFPNLEEFLAEGFSFEDLPPLEELFGGELPCDGTWEFRPHRGHPHFEFFDRSSSA